ncbi:50S ribosomal protein L11 [Thermostilla marina]
MAKKKVDTVRFHVPGGQATPAPPVGTALGRFGVNLGQFVQRFNDATREYTGLRIPVEVTVYDDRSFDIRTQSPHCVDLLKQAAGIAKGAHETPRDKVGKVTKAQIQEIAEKKKADLNAASLEAACRIIEGTARSMGLDVVD